MKRYLDRLRPLFAKGGRFEKYYPVFEMVDVFLYSSPETTHTAPHVRDGIDLKRLMMYVVVALIPCPTTPGRPPRTSRRAQRIRPKPSRLTAGSWHAAAGLFPGRPPAARAPPAGLS
jgi:hypothetical protein